MPRRPSEVPAGAGRPRRARLIALATSAVLLAPAAAARSPSASKRTASAAEREAGPNVTYTGFRRLSDGRALLYVELTAKVPVSVVQQPGGVTYRLEGAHVALKNNKNPLLTGEFATNLLSARLVVPKAPRKKTRGKSEPEARYVDVVLKLRSGVTPTYAISDRPGGAVLEITIPALAANK
jgi:hypothetical protein